MSLRYVWKYQIIHFLGGALKSKFRPDNGRGWRLCWGIWTSFCELWGFSEGFWVEELSLRTVTDDSRKDVGEKETEGGKEGPGTWRYFLAGYW